MKPIEITTELGGVTVITLNRPEAKNALNLEVRSLLAQAFTDLEEDESVNCVVLTGGDVFAAGADIKAMAEATPIEMMQMRTDRYWKPIEAFSRPIIAAVNGFALGGGCELAMHCDMIIAGRSTKFGQPEVKLGIMPGAGGTQRLIRAVGKFHAMRLLLTGDFIGAEEAFAMGLVTKVVDDDKTIDEALALASKIARRPKLAVRQIKEVALYGMDAPLQTALNYERKAFQLLFSSKDQKEGMKAFIEKRQPKYTGE